MQPELTEPGARVDPVFPSRDYSLRTVAFLSLAASVATVVISVAASQILLAAAMAAAIPLIKGRRSSIRALHPVLLPLLLFMGWTILAAFAAHDVLRGLTEVRRFFLYLIVLLTPLVVRSVKELSRMYRLIFLVSAFSSAAALLQFWESPSLDLQHRVTGLMSHWMTFSGLSMLVLVSLAAYSAGRNRVEWWVFPLGALLTVGMYLSQTRNAWLGSVAGLSTVFVLRRPRAMVSLAAVLILVYVASPQSAKHRLSSGWDPNDPETGMRLELVGTSIRLIRHNPWLGVGPKNVNVEALRYRGAEAFPDWLYQHMHNNALQIAAERGIPGLILWLWIIGRLGWDALTTFRSGRKLGRCAEGEEMLWISTGALGALAALIVAGMFEYNFGDSEVVTLFMFLTATPYVFRTATAELGVERRQS